MQKSENLNIQIEMIKNQINKADTIIIGAGAGLSTSAGFTYSGERFEKNFSDFIEKYNFKDMYSAGFYPYETLEEYWAYWSRYIYINRYVDIPKPVYKNLFDLIKHKKYFVITTNVDHCFQKSGFDKQHLFYTQGDYGLWQCSEPCHLKTYDNQKTVIDMVNKQKNMCVPSKLVPYCPICGKPMKMNLRADDTFVEDDGWYQASKRFEDFLEKYKNSQVVFIELGVGMNTPGIIKFNFWHFTYSWSNAVYVCINLNESYAPKEIQNKSICIDADIGNILELLLK